MKHVGEDSRRIDSRLAGCEDIGFIDVQPPGVQQAANHRQVTRQVVPDYRHPITTTVGAFSVNNHIFV